MLCYAMPHKDNFLNSFTRIHRREDTRYVVLCVVWIIDDDRSADDADGITIEECHLVKLAILTIFDVDFLNFLKSGFQNLIPRDLFICGGNCSAS